MISPPNIGHITEHYCSFRNAVLSNAVLSGDLFQLSILMICCDKRKFYLTPCRRILKKKLRGFYLVKKSLSL